MIKPSQSQFTNNEKFEARPGQQKSGFI
jgi:hypothetical protein